MPRTTMPKTTVNKHSKLNDAKNEVWFAWQRHSTPPAGDTCLTHQSNHSQFRGAVPAPSNARHALGTLDSSKYVHHD